MAANHQGGAYQGRVAVRDPPGSQSGTGELDLDVRRSTREGNSTLIVFEMKRG